MALWTLPRVLAVSLVKAPCYCAFEAKPMLLGASLNKPKAGLLHLLGSGCHGSGLARVSRQRLREFSDSTCSGWAVSSMRRRFF